MSLIKNLFFKILNPVLSSENIVLENQKLSPHFHLLTIKGDALKKAEWSAGEKIKVKLPDDQMRSYTPSSWDTENGLLKTLVYMHGKGPGALWARDVKKNTAVTFVGPHASLVLNPEVEEVLFFGDETTFGLAHALKNYTKNIHYHLFFESNDKNESLVILKQFNLSESRVFDLNQLEKISENILSELNLKKTTQIVLSGKQQSIVALREHLYKKNVPKDLITIKVYWGWKDDPNGKLKK